MLDNKREFSIMDFPRENETYGKYKGTYPCQAAYKAFNKLSKLVNLQNTNKHSFIVFSIIDNDSNKVYTYHGTRIKLDRPNVYRKAGKKITSYYKSIVQRYDE